MPRKSREPPVSVVEQHHKLMLELGVDHARRHLYLFGEVDDELSYRVAMGIAVLDAIEGDITVNISSYGGSVEDGLAIYDTLRLAKNRVLTVGYGPVMSMGSILLQAGQTRFMAPNARMLIHDGAWGTYESMLKPKSIGKEAGDTVERMIQILAERAKNLEPATIKRMMAEETFLSAEEAVKFGFADYITMDPKVARAMEKNR